MCCGSDFNLFDRRMMSVRSSGYSDFIYWDEARQEEPNKNGYEGIMIFKNKSAHLTRFIYFEYAEEIDKYTEILQMCNLPTT